MGHVCRVRIIWIIPSSFVSHYKELFYVVIPSFFFLWILSLWQLCEPLEWVIVEYGSWVCCWGNNEFYLIWFFSFRETHREDFPQTTTALCQAQRWYAPMKQTNKQITANDLCVWEKHMAAHVSVSVFFPHCLSLLISLPVHVCVCVCIRLGTDLSSSWQTPSTATAGPQPVDAERPKLQERSRGPKIFPWPLKALLIFTVSCF